MQTGEWGLGGCGQKGGPCNLERHSWDGGEGRTLMSVQDSSVNELRGRRCRVCAHVRPTAAEALGQQRATQMMPAPESGSLSWCLNIRVENHSTFGIFPLHNFLLHVLSSLPECSLINISFSHLHLLELELWLLNGGL